jgi:hypothetical protein
MIVRPVGTREKTVICVEILFQVLVPHQIGLSEVSNAQKSNIVYGESWQGRKSMIDRIITASTTPVR